MELGNATDTRLGPDCATKRWWRKKYTPVYIICDFFLSVVTITKKKNDVLFNSVTSPSLLHISMCNSDTLYTVCPISLCGIASDFFLGIRGSSRTKDLIVLPRLKSEDYWLRK